MAQSENNSQTRIEGSEVRRKEELSRSRSTSTSGSGTCFGGSILSSTTSTSHKIQL
ncbi:hypothetical protein Hanom_Chr09g00824431 [Helianthus anomalus]